jgi:oxygen-independent coproporphyrinogen-3 oxidase
VTVIMSDWTLPPVNDALLARLDVPGPRYTSYPTAPMWTTAFGPADHARALEASARAASEPISLYVHIPFCREMCTYCGCNVIVTKDPRKADRYLDAVTRELALVAERLGARRTLSRLHLGGGTPTSLTIAQLERLAKAIFDRFSVAAGAELAVEIDPMVTSYEQLALLAALGWNRLSMGVQDFEPRVQEAVRRIQSVEQTAETVAWARRLGYRSVNFDLIYGLPFQTAESWARTIARVVELGPDRIATYSFAHVPAAKPHQRLLPIANLPGAKEKIGLLRVANEGLRAAGYRAIGMDHFARPEDELSRALDERRLWRDFQGYTVKRAADTIGVGVSGISSLAGAYAQNVKSLAAHEAAIAERRLPVERGLLLDDDDRRRREVITGLMCNGWIDVGDGFATELDALEPFVRDGVVEVKGTEISLTPLGRMFVRNVAMVFDAYLAREGEQLLARHSRTV